MRTTERLRKCLRRDLNDPGLYSDLEKESSEENYTNFSVIRIFNSLSNNYFLARMNHPDFRWRIGLMQRGLDVFAGGALWHSDSGYTLPASERRLKLIKTTSRHSSAQPAAHTLSSTDTTRHQSIHSHMLNPSSLLKAFFKKNIYLFGVLIDFVIFSPRFLPRRWRHIPDGKQSTP